ncbi:hypothetical protein WJX72_010697 [[Myrmecia] bisecta]|uniref:TFIIB-type domain-containing protein n=1 Tax=[Myrmecia] bisecta TaxID=41462 RepID=A0AAW1R9P5_9CHLO
MAQGEGQVSAWRQKYEQTCPDCGSSNFVEDHSQGDLICTSCGLVVEAHAIDERSEWRTFSEKDKESADPTRVGGPTNDLLTDGGIGSTTIGAVTKGDGGSLAKDLQRMHARGSNPDKALLASFGIIARMCENLHLVRSIKDRACELFTKIASVKSIRARGSQAVCAALVYIACRQEGNPRTFKEICTVVDASKVDIGRCYKLIVKELEQTMEAVHVADFMRRFCSHLGLNNTDMRAATEIAEAAMPRVGRDDAVVKPWQSKSPISIAAAIIYMVVSLPKASAQPNIINIATVAGVAEGTLRTTYRDLYPDAANLVLFLDNRMGLRAFKAYAASLLTCWVVACALHTPVVLGERDVEAEHPSFLAGWSHELRHTVEGVAEVVLHYAKYWTAQPMVTSASEEVRRGKPMAEMTDTEFRAAYLGQRTARPKGLTSAVGPYRYENVEPPKEVDWLAKGVVGPVKNQHVNGSPCGCCWAFATIGVVECINAMYTGSVTSLSEQQLIDCDTKPPYSDAGCEGGDFAGGMHYIIENEGIDTEDDYPYLAHDARCHKRRAHRGVVTIDAFEDVPTFNETALMQAVSQHPVGVALCVGPYIDDWHAYKSGIFDIEGCVDPLDHGMVVVGYGEEDGQKFWLLKNSWGPEWGDKGFLKLKRGLGNAGHMGLATMPAYPIKTTPNPPVRDDPRLASLFGRKLASQ